MAFYKDPEEMFRCRAERMKKEADVHWAQAKSGEGDFHYGKARKLYGEAAENLEKADKSKGKTW